MARKRKKITPRFVSHKGYSLRKIGIIFWIIALALMFIILSAPYLRNKESVFQKVIITPGMRQEEVARAFGRVMSWSDKEERDLIRAHSRAFGGNGEGYYFPTTYTVATNMSPKAVSDTIRDTFYIEVVEKNERLKNSATTTDLIIRAASIIEREADTLSDMKIVSGVIWNRLAKNMNLQMDATLQYVKGTPKKWWPIVVSKDKFTDSPYNTYKYAGLPPTAIANPGLRAINAALNPAKTNALFYIHDRYGNIYTSQKYSDHLFNIDMYLRGY